MTTTRKTIHANCFHDNTKSARAACRRDRAKFAADEASYENEFLRPLREMEAARDAFDKACEIFADAHVSSAHQNADDTSREESFGLYTTRWYQVALSTLEHARDNAEKVFRADDAEKGQALQVKGGSDWVWIDAIEYAGKNGWPTAYTVVDRDGKRSKITPEDIDLDA